MFLITSCIVSVKFSINESMTSAKHHKWKQGLAACAFGNTQSKDQRGRLASITPPNMLYDVTYRTISYSLQCKRVFLRNAPKPFPCAACGSPHIPELLIFFLLGADQKSSSFRVAIVNSRELRVFGQTYSLQGLPRYWHLVQFFVVTNCFQPFKYFCWQEAKKLEFVVDMQMAKLSSCTVANNCIDVTIH